MLKLINIVEAIPDDIFCSKGVMIDLNRAFNVRLQAELCKKFGATLHNAHPVMIDDLYSYTVERLIPLFAQLMVNGTAACSCRIDALS